MAVRDTRSRWLVRASGSLKRHFKRRGARLPRRIVLWSCDLPPGIAGHYTHTPGDPPVVQISSRVRSGRVALLILIHELCHVAVGSPHPGPHQALVRSFGIRDVWPYPRAGHEHFAPLLKRLGPYPPE